MPEQYKKRVYISGPIEGVEDYQTNFAHAEDKVAKMGCDPVNPARCFEPVKDTLTRGQIMGLCINLLEECDCIYLLPGWQLSKGAKEELAFAIKNSIEVMVSD